VYHGLPEGLYRCDETPVPDPVLLGRISPAKRVNRAIEIAKRIGMVIKIIAKVDAADWAYCEDIIAPLVAEPFTSSSLWVRSATTNKMHFSGRLTPCFCSSTDGGSSSW
jgi:hypothetical protein